ncbi:hypothetical protein BKA63DRAFT_66588 [Paraphoma chrysanthemicola]|nr:hypothetical protein BKA63DRAFT_66588 [Paraphoma chrysanthemicola]
MCLSVISAVIIVMVLAACPCAGRASSGVLQLRLMPLISWLCTVYNSNTVVLEVILQLRCSLYRCDVVVLVVLVVVALVVVPLASLRIAVALRLESLVLSRWRIEDDVQLYLGSQSMPSLRTPSV